MPIFLLPLQKNPNPFGAAAAPCGLLRITDIMEYGKFLLRTYLGYYGTVISAPLIDRNDKVTEECHGTWASAPFHSHQRATISQREHEQVKETYI